MSSVWRRKTSILAVIVLTILLVICLQYNVTKEIVEITLSRQQSLAEEAERNKVAMPQRGRVRSVQFLSDEAYATRDNAAVQDVVGRQNEIDYQKLAERRRVADYGLENVYRRSGNTEVGDRSAGKQLPNVLYILRCNMEWRMCFRYRTSLDCVSFIWI